jgi:hypothetical protein
MQVEKIVTALLLGLSWERILCCPFIALSLSLSDRWAGLRFITGRLSGICVLGIVVSVIGLPFQISSFMIDGIFSVFLLFLSVKTFLLSGHQANHKGNKGRFSQAGFVLGIFRGFLNPGRKIVYLLPLLWGVSVVEGLIISLVYAVSSSCYLLIGFFSAELVNRIAHYRKGIKIAGGITLGILGFYYLYKTFQGGS